MRTCTLLLFPVCVASCAAQSEAQGHGGDHGESSEGGALGAGGQGQGGSVASGSGGTGVISSGAGGNVNPTTPPILYMHTGLSLYQADAAAAPLDVEYVGDFTCVGGDGQDASMTDIAVDENGELWGVSASNVYHLAIEGGSVGCSEVIALNNPDDNRFYGLTFAPRGTLDDEHEVLIAGNSAGELWSIDGEGNLAQRGTLGTVPSSDGNGHAYDSENVGKPWELSGDIVFASNNGSPIGFATVRDCPNPPEKQECSDIDTLIELDLSALKSATTGSVLKDIRGAIVQRDGCDDGVTGSYGSVYGTAIYEGKVYGFSQLPSNAGGYAIDIDNTDGGACLVGSVPVESWAGAGITTVVYVEAPPPK